MTLMGLTDDSEEETAALLLNRNLKLTENSNVLYACEGSY